MFTINLSKSSKLNILRSNLVIYRKCRPIIRGRSGLSLWKTNFELEGSGEGQGTYRHFKGGLGPFVQYCPCEASEQKMGQEQKSELKEIELSYYHQLIITSKLVTREHQSRYRNTSPDLRIIIMILIRLIEIRMRLTV